MHTWPHINFYILFFSKNNPKTKQMSIGRKKFNMDPKKVSKCACGNLFMSDVSLPSCAGLPLCAGLPPCAGLLSCAGLPLCACLVMSGVCGLMTGAQGDIQG